MKIFLISLVIMEMQFKTTRKCHFVLMRMAILMILKITSISKDRKIVILVHYWWESKFVQPLLKTYWQFLRNTENRITTWLSNSPKYISQRIKSKDSNKYVYIHFHSNIVHGVANSREKLSAHKWMNRKTVWCICI